MNDAIFNFFYSFAHQSVLMDSLIVFFAVYFPYIVILMVFLFLLFHHEVVFSSSPVLEFIKKWKEIVLIFFTSGFAWIVAKILKIIIHTDRPFIALENVRPLFSETGFAFPSGHATLFFALATGLFLCHKKVGYLFGFFALLIGLARIAGGVHFPIDILGGFVLGFAISALVAYFQKNV